MNIVYGTDGNVYETSISNGNEYMSSKKEKEELEERKTITKEEAIMELQNTIDLIKQDGKDWVDERDIPIFEMAIKALKGE